MTTPSKPVIQVLSPGLAASVQDHGRRGLSRFGIPRSGPMDPHASTWANRLLSNPLHAPTLELLLQGAELLTLSDAWITICGADQSCNLPTWKTVRVQRGDLIHFARNQSGVWCYLAVEGGFSSPAHAHFGSLSGDPSAKLGCTLAPNQILHHLISPSLILPPRVAARRTPWNELRNYLYPPKLRVWPGPQWNLFPPTCRERFFTHEWTVTSRSSRTGYRFAGPKLLPNATQIQSEGVIPGSIQVPADGQPIVTMNDGPTIGGYPKIGLLHPEDLSWLAQCRPSTQIQFTLLENPSLQ